MTGNGSWYAGLGGDRGRAQLHQHRLQGVAGLLMREPVGPRERLRRAGDHGADDAVAVDGRVLGRQRALQGRDVAVGPVGFFTSPSRACEIRPSSAVTWVASDVAIDA